ncbi:MAG: hypothetical protein E6J13_01620 [Chloroflexi bacterium]|nr:MAG: hypothetical protein E6J13_01620 [Chloroflexota bacterium]
MTRWLTSVVAPGGMLGWIGQMSVRERAALFAWASAFIAVAALPFGYWRASQECFYSPEDFSRCDSSRVIAVLGEVAATAFIAAAIWITRNQATSRAHVAARIVGAVGLGLAFAGSLAAVWGDAYVVARPIAAIGFGALGVALAVESDRGDDLVRSNLGMLLGITLAVWAIAYAARDDIILPTGGAFFFIPYGVWAVRLGYRLGFGKTPAITKARPVFGEIGWSVGAAVLVLIAFPFWITSTFGVASLGDPANSVTVKNETGEGIVFYQYRGETAYPERIEAGQAKTSDWFEHGTYSPAAEDLTGVEIFCRRLEQRELRRAHFVVTVVRDPASCASR